MGSGCRLTLAFSSAQCPAENCNGDRAYFFQLQIRSADEPMTTFLKVRFCSTLFVRSFFFLPGVTVALLGAMLISKR